MNKKALNKFLMTLAATTISILLTFGTTAIIDRVKQKKAKREMVMMVMFDMQESLEKIERCNGELKGYFDLQLDIVAHPEKFAKSCVLLASKVPVLDYTTTTENIFRSNIETLRTIGNILFVQTVSSFYDTRNRYGTEVVEGFQDHATQALVDYEALRVFDSPVFIFRSNLYLNAMRRDFEKCKLMMNVSDKELEVFGVQQQKIQDAVQVNFRDLVDDTSYDMLERRKQLQEAREAAGV